MKKHLQDMTLLAVSDSRDYLLILKEYAARMGIFTDFYFAFDGKEALEKVEQHQPDLMVIDLILPKIDALGVLEALTERNMEKNTKVIVCSGTGGDFFVNKSFKYGADYFFIKPIAYETFRGRVMDLFMEEVEQDPLVQASTAGMITHIIQRLGLPVGSKGYKFVRYAIELVLNDATILENMTKVLYPAVAEQFGSTPQRVERNIRHAIEVAWNKGDLSFIEKLFGYTVDADRGKPTNSAFLAAVTDYITINLLKVD